MSKNSTPPFSFEIHDGDAGTICIKQVRTGRTSVVVLDPDEAVMLHQFLDPDRRGLTGDKRDELDPFHTKGALR